MRITTKRIRMIEMSREELEAFHATMERAAQGQHVNYAEQKLNDGSFLGVSILSEKEQREAADNERQAKFEAQRARAV